MWNLKYDTNELIYKTETDSQTQRTDLWLPRGGMDWEFGISRCKLLDKQQGPTVEHRELYSISCDKPSWKTIWKRMCVYIYICV